MTEDDADELLLLMSQLWFAGTLIPDGTLQLWHKSLLALEKDLAAQCVQDLAKEKAFWPAISEFRLHYSARVRRIQSEIKPIQREYLPREKNVERLRELRKSLRANR